MKKTKKTQAEGDWVSQESKSNPGEGNLWIQAYYTDSYGIVKVRYRLITKDGILRKGCVLIWL